MRDPNPSELRLDLRRGDHDWQVTLETQGRREELPGLRALIRYLESLAVVDRPTTKGLR